LRKGGTKSCATWDGEGREKFARHGARQHVEVPHPKSQQGRKTAQPGTERDSISATKKRGIRVAVLLKVGKRKNDLHRGGLNGKTDSFRRI